MLTHDEPPPGGPPPIDSTETLEAAPISSGAGFGIRFLARLIDAIYGLALTFFVAFFSGILFAVLSHFGKLSPNWAELMGERSAVGFGFGIVGAFLYHSFAEGMGSATVGKAICGLRVVSLDGGAADLDATLKRDIAYHWDALFCGLIAYTAMEKGPLRQRYGDRWGKTVVVKAANLDPQAGRSGARMTIGILVGSLLWGSMVIIQLVLKVI